MVGKKHLVLLLVELCLRPPTVRSFLSATNPFRKATTVPFQRPIATTLNMVLEVEQKFRIDTYNNAEIAATLEEMGFERKGEPVTFADWYFDDLSCLCLSLQDCWLRYREVGDLGQWQLKRGQSSPFGDTSIVTKSTVYEEIEGPEAVEIALSIVKSRGAATTIEKDIKIEGNFTMEGYPAPIFPTEQAHSLYPFVRLVTTRTSWILRHTRVESLAAWNGKIQVDLDTTNTNYAVGEVETVVDAEEQVPAAQAVVKQVIDQLLGESGKDSPPPIGKLEHFLLKTRPKHYQALAEVGVVDCSKMSCQ
jgi:CYTH domain